MNWAGPILCFWITSVQSMNFMFLMFKSVCMCTSITGSIVWHKTLLYCEWCNCVLNLNVCGDISVEFSCFGCGTILLKTPLRMFRVFCIFQWSNTSYSPKHSWYLYWQKAEPKMVELNFEESSIIQQLLMIKEKCLLFKTALEKSSSTHVATWHP